MDSSRYIIFADDDADDLELITGFFQEYNPNINILEFKDGKEVLKFLDEFAYNTSRPILIVLDINMPRMNGKDTLLAIRKHHSFHNIPVVVYTTSSNEADEEFCKKNNATWVVKSPSLEGIRNTARILAEFCELQKHE